MIYRSMPTGEELSLLGFGTMRMPTTRAGAGTESIDPLASTELVDCAIAEGVNYFDTAWPYHKGEAEMFLGMALVERYSRDSFYLATKLPTWKVSSPEEAEALFMEQLAKLRTDYIDFYLMHALDGERLDHIINTGLLAWATDLQIAGRIKRLGFSFHGTIDDLKRIIAAYNWDFGQLQINYLDWELQKAGQAYQILIDAKIPIIVMEPLRGGKLAKLASAAEDILKAVHLDRSIASWGFRFAGELSGVVTVLSGMNTMRQLQDNIATYSVQPESALQLSDLEHRALIAALHASNLTAAIPCTACRYCMPCPHDVDIAGVFDSYNAYKVNDSVVKYESALKMLEDDTFADFCTACGKCAPQCPQDIDISKEMEKIADETVKLFSVDLV